MSGDRRDPFGPALALGLALLALAGFVDGVGFLGVGLFPSFMSGDTTQFAVALRQRDTARAVTLGAAVVIFVAGAFLGRLLRLRTGARAPTLLAQAAVLAIAAFAARAGFGAPALACAVLAMGAQTVVVTHAGSEAIGATFVTGALARLGSGLADALDGRDRTGWIAQLLAWGALAAGAVLGALAYTRGGLGALGLAATAAALAAVAVWWVETRRSPA